MFATLEIFWRHLGLSIFRGFEDQNNSGKTDMLSCSGIPDSSSRWSVWRFFRCPWMVLTELCHLLSYWHEVPFLSFLSVLFVDRVQQKVITGSSALAFLARSWMIPEVTPGCRQEKRVSGVWASPHFLLSTAAPSKDRLLPHILLLCRMAALTKHVSILL